MATNNLPSPIASGAVVSGGSLKLGAKSFEIDSDFDASDQDENDAWLANKQANNRSRSNPTPTRSPRLSAVIVKRKLASNDDDDADDDQFDGQELIDMFGDAINDAKISCYEIPPPKTASRKSVAAGRRYSAAISNKNDKRYDKGEQLQPSTAQANDDLANDISFEVELGKSTDFEPITWTFPNTTRCPLQQCSISRPSRTQALNHFRMDHADITMLCTICDELFLAINSEDLRQHHEQMHPQPRLKKKSSEPVELEESAPKPNTYCWDCESAYADRRCSKCERHFHQKCVENPSDSHQICNYCSEKDVFRPFDVGRIPNILGFIKIDPKFDALTKTDIKFTAERTQKPVDFSKMEQKAKAYGCVKEFEEDIKWFQHNCRTIFRNVHEKQEASARLIRCVKELILGVQIVSCGECYDNAYEHLTQYSVIRPCSRPHLLLWARLKSNCYWPAKVMAISIDRKRVYLQFFGDYTCDILTITRDNCYLYSEEYPENKSHQDSTKYLEALKDARDYIDHIQHEFPKFNYDKANVVFNPAKMSDYLNQMTAGWDVTNAETSYDWNVNAESTPGNDARANNDNDSNTANDMSNQGRPRKRNARASNSSNSSRAKTPRTDTISDYFTRGFGDFQKVFAEGTKKIDKLQDDYDKLKNENKIRKQKNATLVEEKKELDAAMSEEKTNSEKRYIALVNATNEEKETLANEKKTLLEETKALKMEMQKLKVEEKDLKEKNEELERFKNRVKSAFT